MDATSGVGCVICQDTEKCRPFKLTCGHAFGRSCMQEWIESTGQKNCVLCKKQLTDDEVKRIKRIPLYDRAVNILIKAIPIFGKTALYYFSISGLGTALSVIRDGFFKPSQVVATAAAVATFFPTATIGTLGAVAGVPLRYATAAGAAAGACTVAMVDQARAAAAPYPYRAMFPSAAAVCIWGAALGCAATGIAYCVKK
ncbi:RING finger domain-containing protein [Endozoicomonas acroporae]|uniref:RING finger domain-containing protein n=1 Tax=Endozoicomonas acroporae TaxID=1701104 RepID=UPI000C782DF4|nr:RING finger domain-containing protein [Endozoicomonas acroporae]